MNRKLLQLPPSIISGKVLSIKPHPNATKLKIAQVQINDHKNVQVVCGAQNLKIGMISILAQIGSTLPSGLSIKLSEIRGEKSEGMLCSPIELDLHNEQGIIDLPPNSKIGVPIQVFPIADLSSTPWYSLKLIDQFFCHKKTKIILKVIPKDQALSDFQLTSETYFNVESKNYCYRKYES